VQDNAGRAHFNGGDTNQTNYNAGWLQRIRSRDRPPGRRASTSKPFQSMEVENSRFSADNGRGSAGVLDLTTKMGDDRWRFGVTNFFPGISSDGGFHVNKWTPRLEFSGPLAKGRAWFSQRVRRLLQRGPIHGLPSGQKPDQRVYRQRPFALPGQPDARQYPHRSFLFNLADTARSGSAF